MENNPENQKNPLEIHSLAIAGVLDSKNDSTSGPSPKKVIQLGVVQSSIGNRSSTISLNKKSRWDQAPDSGEEIDLKQPNIELPDGEQNASIKNLIQKFENFTEISSLPGIIQSDELPIKPVGSQTNNRVKLVRTNFMKIDKPTSVSSKTNTDNNTSSEPQQKDGINKQSTSQTSISEAPHETEVKPVTSSTALSIISSCYDSPSDDSSQEIDVSCTPENKTTDSAYTSLEKMDALKGSTKIENSGEIHTEKVTSTIEMEFDNKPTESISKSKISCKDEHTDSKEDISTKDNKQISCTQLFPEENVSTKDNMDDELNFPDITDIESGLKPVSSESSVKTSTVVGNEITNDNLIKLIINPTLSSNVSDNETKTEESLLFDINKDNSFQTTDKDSVNEAIESKVGDLNQLPEIIEEEKGNSQNISDKEENICSSKLVEKVGVDGQHSENICEILPSVENITCKDQSETEGSEDNIKTSLVKECYLHGQIIEAKTSGVDDTIGNVLSDSSFANKVNPLTSPSESQGNDEDISASDNLSNISHSDPSEAQRNIIEQRTCSLTCEEDEIKEFRDEIPPDIEKTPILEEICIRKEMYITGDNSNISGENNRNENQNILSDTAEENITENISVYRDAVDATMERMFSDSLESSKVSLYCIEQSNKEDMTLCQTINMSQDSMPKEEIFSTNENKKVSVIESNKIESHETNASLLEILESENSQSNCSDSKKDILEERSDVSTKVSSTSKANEILSITLPDTCSDEIELSVSCVSKKEIISKTVVSYEKEVEMTSEPTKSTENVEQCLTIDNIETIDLEKGNNEITSLVKMAQGTIDTETSNQETIGLEQSNQDNSKKLLLNISDISGDEISGPERDSENLNDTTTKHTFIIQPISLDHSENVEECTVIETLEGAQELTDTEVIVEPLKVNPANENNISQKMSENKPSISHFDDNSELHRNVDSTETIVLEEINPGNKISKSTDTMSTGIDESKHNLLVTNSDQNLDSLEDIFEDKQSYEKSIDTSFSTTDNIIATNEFINENTIRSDKFSVVEYKTSKSDDVKQVETNYEVSVEVNETTRKQFSDTDMVSSEGYLPLNKNENFETSSHNKTESKITSDLLLIDEELESKRLPSLECAPEKEVMNPTEHVEERGSKIQVELSPNSSESVSFSTVNKTNVVNEPIKNKSISYSTSETHSDSTNLVCSIESTTDNDSEGKINIVKPDICYTTDVEGLKQKVESETLDTRRTDEEEYFASKYNKIDDPDLLLEKITSTSKNELLPSPEIESTITIKSLVSKPLDNEQNSLLSSVGAENLQIHEDNPTDESTIVASQESEVNNVQCKTTTVEVVVKEQSSEMEIPKSEKTGIELGTVSKVENKDCMEFSASLDNFTESMIYTSSLVSKEENIDNRNLESQQLSSVSKKIDDLDKSTYSYEEESEQRLTQEDKIKQGNISINEPDENLDHTIKNSNVDKLIVSEEKSNDIQLNIDKKEEISNIVSQTNADLSTEVVIENVDDKQSLNSPKEILSFDNNAGVIMGECLPKDLTEGSQSSNQTSIENSTTNIDNHSKTGLNKEMFSPSPQPQAHTENDLSEHTSEHKFHDEEKDCPEDDKDTVMEVICDDVKVDTIQAIDSFLRDTNSENNVKLEAEICKDGKTSGTIESHSYHSGQETNKTEVTDNSLSLEKQINCEIYQSYSKTPQEHETFQKEAVSKELHDNNERPKTCIGKEINLGTVSSFEKEYQERGYLVSDLDSVSDKENPLKKSCSEKHENEKFEELKDISSLNDEDLAREKSFETVTTSMISDTNISLQPQKLSQFSEIVLSQCPSQTPLKSSQEDNASSDLQNSSSDQIDSKVEVENQIKGQSMKKPEIVIDSCSSQQITITSPHKLLQPSKIFSSQCPSQISSKDSSQENVSSDVQISSLNQSDSKLEMKTETEEQNTKEPKVATDICSSKLEINNQIQELNIEKRDVITDICSSQPNTILFSSQNLPQSIDIVSSQYHSQTSLNNKMQGKDVSDDQISSSILNDSILELDNQIKEPNINTHEIITKVCPNLQEPISSSLLESKVNILPKEVNIESSDSCFSSLDSLKNIEDEVHIKSSDIVLKEDKIYSKDVSHVDIEAVNILKAEPVQETKFKQSEEVLGTLAKEVDNSSNFEVEKTTEVSSKHIMSPDNYQPNDTPKNKKSLIANSSETRRSSLSKDVEKISKSNAYPQLKSDVSPECSSTEAIDLNNTTEITDSQPDNSITKTLLSDKCIEVREKDERLTQDKSFLDDTEVKSNDEDKETCKTEMSFEEAEVIESAVTNSAIAKDGNIAEQNKISLGNLSSSTVDDKTSNKGMTSMSVEAVDTNDDDNNSSILKHSRKKQKKNPDVQTESEKSNEVSSPKSERQTVEPTTEDPVELSSHKILSESPQFSDSQTKLITKSIPVKEVPPPVRVSARQKQRQAAAAAALAAEEKSKTGKDSPECVSKKSITQDKDKRGKKSLSPTKELQIKVSSGKVELSKQSPILVQKSPKNLDGKQSSHISPKRIVKELGQDKLEPITLKLSKEDNPVIVRSSSLSPKKILSPLSPQTKTLGYTLKIGKDSTTIVPKDSTVSPNTRDSSPSSSSTKADLSGKVGYLIKDTGLTITPIAPTETQEQKLSKITLKLSKAGGHPEIKQEKSETWKAIQKLGEIDIVPVEGKPHESSKRKDKSDQDSPEKKIKLGEITVEPSGSGMSKLQGLLTQAPLNQSDDSEDIQFVGFGPSPEKVQPTQPLTYDVGLVKQETETTVQKRRGRPRKILSSPEIGHAVGQSIPPGMSAKDILAVSLQHQTLQQHIQQIQPPISITPSEEQECSATMFPVPLFDLSEDTFMDPTPPTVFPEQVQPQTILRSARGRPIGRSRRPRGSGILRAAERGGPRGRPRGSRGIKRMLEEMEALSYPDVDEHITLDNIDSEIGPRMSEQSGSQITEKTIALLRKSIEGKKEGIDKRARKSDSGDEKNRDSDIDAQVREMKEKIEAAYQAELKFPGKEGKKKTCLEKIEGREKKGPPELIPLQKSNSPDKKVKANSPSNDEECIRKKSADEKYDSFHGVGKESLKRKFVDENPQKSSEGTKRKSIEDRINESKQSGSSQDQSENENFTTEGNNSRRESLKGSDNGDTMDIDQPISPEEPDQVVEVKSEPEPPPKPVKPRPKSKAEIKRIKREKDRIRREAKKLAALEALKLAPPPNPFEEDTRMSATDPNGEGTDEFGSGIKKNRMEVGDPEGKEFTVDQIAEYQWPLQGGELYMIQEQISTYLGVKSFKRKYPDLKRRPVEMEERTFLCDSGLVSESMCDLGLTAVSSSEVLDIMFQDFQEQYEELRKHMREKQARELINKQKERKKFELSLSKSDLKEQAIQSAVSWNSQLNRSRSESRRCHLDLQTWTIQYPRSRGSKMTRPTPKMGNYPVALIPGQYADFCKRYTAQELRYWPVNTVLYGPLQPNERHSTGGSDGSQSESEDSSSSDDSSDSSSEGEGTCEEEEKGCKACGGKRGSEALVQCSQCGHNIHVSCADLNPGMLVHVRKYPWQCSVCKTCQRCNNSKNESKMLFCDVCDRGFHSYCVGLRRVPQGSWTCTQC